MGDPQPPLEAFSDEDRRELLRIARTTLREYLHSGRLPPGHPHRASLLVPAAAWVALHYKGNGALRSRAGRADTTVSLYRAVQEAAVAAVTSEWRGPPLTFAELDDCRLEITLPCTGRPAGELLELAPGEGLALDSPAGRALLLPQELDEKGLSAAEAVAELSRQLGYLDAAGRPPGCTLERVHIDVFDEDSHPPIDFESLFRHA